VAPRDCLAARAAGRRRGAIRCAFCRRVRRDGKCVLEFQAGKPLVIVTKLA
jgi:hypothetical protein